MRFAVYFFAREGSWKVRYLCSPFETADVATGSEPIQTNWYHPKKATVGARKNIIPR